MLLVEDAAVEAGVAVEPAQVAGAATTNRYRRTANARCSFAITILWSREVATSKETQLTTDGVKDFGYATDNAGWAGSDRPIVAWSPDGKKMATFQQDQRGVGEMYLVSTAVGHPELKAWKYPLPGDEVVTTIQRVVIDVADPHVVRAEDAG